jgi:replicative DNA helicase
MNKIELAIQNEQFFLGAILKDGTLIEESRLREEHFINISHRDLYRVMLDLKNSGKDISVIAIAHLGESKTMQFGGTRYLGKLMNSVPSVNAFKSYESRILQYWTIEEGQTYCNEFLEKTKETFNTDDLQELIQKVNRLESQTVTKGRNFKELLYERYQHHEETPESGLSGTDTGFMKLNAITDGWQASDLVIIGARPSMGKTAFILNSMLNAAEKPDVMTTFFSIEMAEGQIIDRLLASKGRINLMKMRNPNKHFQDDERNRYAKAMGELENLNMDVRSESTVPEIRAVIRRNVKNNPDKKHAVFIDFLTLIKAINQRQNRHNEVEEIVQDLKQIAKDLNIPVIVLSQLSRALEQRQDKRPMMSDLRESGAIEQTADMVLFLYRDDYYNKDAVEGLTEIGIAKSRNGKIGVVDMKFIKETNTFREMA